MSELASRSQLRWSFARWALLTVPVVLFVGSAAGRLSNSGFDNLWFAALAKPGFMPPGWAFAVVWPVLYILMGFALAVVLHARGARGREIAVLLFAAQLLVNLSWSPLFFAAHQVTVAFWVIVAMLVLGIATTIAFGRIRARAAWLMVPYLVWISFACLLNYEIDRLNPGAETLVPSIPKAQIDI